MDRRIVSLVASALAALVSRWSIERAHADDPPASGRAGWLCVSPRKGPFNECWKGNSHGEGEVERCRARQATRKPRPSRLRIDGGAWIEFPRTTWRCVALPTDHSPRVVVENYGRAYATFRIERVRSCRSGVVDLVGPNFYGAMYAHCSRRDHARDERLP